MATIRKRGKFQYQAIVRRNKNTVTKTFSSKRDAERWGRETESDIERGCFINRTEAEKNTVADILERYEEEVSKNKKTFHKERYTIKHFNNSSLAKISLAHLSSKHIATYIKKRKKKTNIKNETIKRDLNLLSHAINYARKNWGIAISENPCSLVTLPMDSKARERRLLAGEWDYLLNAASKSKNIWIKPFIEIALETAMRRGEIVSLEWQNINLKRKTAKIYDTKNGEDRNIPLSTKAMETLKSLPRDLTGKVFPLTANAIDLAWKRTRIRARQQYEEDYKRKKPVNDYITGFRFHDIRHEATSRFFELGLGIMEVSSITGHKDLKMLQRYTHLKAEDLAKKLG